MMNEDPNVDLDMFNEEEVDKWITEKENYPAKMSPKRHHKTVNTSAFEDDFYDELDDSVCEEWLNQNEKIVNLKSLINSQSTSNRNDLNLVLSQPKKLTKWNITKYSRRGVQFLDEEDSQTDAESQKTFEANLQTFSENNLQNKCEENIEKNKRKHESPVVTNKRRKIKMKNNSLFKI